MARLRRDSGAGRAVLPPHGTIVDFDENGISSEVDDETALDVAGSVAGYSLLLEHVPAVVQEEAHDVVGVDDIDEDPFPAEPEAKEEGGVTDAAAKRAAISRRYKGEVAGVRAVARRGR